MASCDAELLSGAEGLPACQGGAMLCSIHLLRAVVAEIEDAEGKVLRKRRQEHGEKAGIS